MTIRNSVRANPPSARNITDRITIPFGAPFREATGVARSTQHELIKRGEIASVLVGGPRGRRVIIVSSWLHYLERQRQREFAGEIGMVSPNPRARKQRSAH
jgi:hypothetical protein